MGLALGAVIFVVLVFYVLIIVLRNSLGLEKLYPLILFALALLLVVLVLFKKIDQITFGTTFGVIVGAFITAFRDIIDAIREKWKKEPTKKRKKNNP